MKKIDYFINELVDIGLNNSEAKVYYYLLKKKHFTAMELSKLAHIPTSKIYNILNNLVEKGLCTEILGKVKKYSPVDPDSGFDNLYNELEKKKEKITKIKEGLTSLYHSAKETTDPLDYIKVLRDKKTIINTFNALEEQAQNEVLSFVKRPLIMEETTKTAKQLEEAAKEYVSLTKGVSYKTIHEKKDLQDERFLEVVEFYAQAGEETRITAKMYLPFKMYIFDEKKVMFTLEDKLKDEMSVTSLIIEHPDLVKGLKMIFYIYWNNAIPFEKFQKEQKNKA